MVTTWSLTVAFGNWPHPGSHRPMRSTMPCVTRIQLRRSDLG